MSEKAGCSVIRRERTRSWVGPLGWWILGVAMLCVGGLCVSVGLLDIAPTYTVGGVVILCVCSCCRPGRYRLVLLSEDECSVMLSESPITIRRFAPGTVLDLDGPEIVEAPETSEGGGS